MAKKENIKKSFNSNFKASAGNKIIKIKTKRLPDYLPDPADKGRIYRIDKRAKRNGKSRKA